MGQGGFAERLRASAHARESWLCVGLDPDPTRLPASVERSGRGITRFCQAIIDATADVACAYKANFAFFELMGADGWRALEETRAHVPPDIPIIADAKRGDIGNTARAYADAILTKLGFDAVTVNPYLGWDSLEPFFGYEGKGVFVLCKTSNPGADDLQALVVDGEPLYMRVARQAISLRVPADIGLVVGATQPAALRAVRAIDRETILLVPGVGAQGADAAEAISYAANDSGDNALITVSREILFASRDDNYVEAGSAVARRRARETWHASSRTS